MINVKIHLTQTPKILKDCIIQCAEIKKQDQRLPLLWMSGGASVCSQSEPVGERLDTHSYCHVGQGCAWKSEKIYVSHSLLCVFLSFQGIIVSFLKDLG